MESYNTKIKSGVLYIVFNNQTLLDEAVYSAKTLKNKSPHIEACIITNLSLSQEYEKIFTHKIFFQYEIHPLKLKIKLLEFTPFEKTLFLDADTEILKPIDELFLILDKYLLAFTFDNYCDWTKTPHTFIAQESSDINTGFLLFNKTTETLSIFKTWYEKISSQDESDMWPGHNCDQVYFNDFIFDEIKRKKISYSILSNEIYNVRPWCWDFLKQNGKYDSIVVLHAHNLNKKSQNIKKNLKGKFFLKIKKILKIMFSFSRFLKNLLDKL